MDENNYSDFLDLLYEAAFEPELWVTVMERFADMVGGTSSWLSHLNLLDGTGDGVIARIDPDMPAVYQKYYALKNPLSNVKDPYEYLRNWVPRILTDEDWMSKSELVNSEYYNDFLAPQDIHSTMMIRLSTDGFDVNALNVNRPRSQPQYGAEELALARSLQPHMIRAFKLAQKFASVRQLNQDLADALDHSTHGIILLDLDGRVRHANKCAEALIAGGDSLCVVAGRLSAHQPDAGRRLGALIASAADRAAARGGTMALPSGSRRLPLSVTVAPARSSRIDVFERGPAVMVCVTDLEAGVRLPEQQLRELFGLTPAEARVMLSLFEGHTPQETAERQGISFHTVRVHLGRIFEKTGAHRQTELVQLMMRTVGVRQD